MNEESVRRVLDDPLAQQLLTSSIPARLAYTALDGTPRVIPIGFLWDGARFVICTVPGSPKVRALAKRPEVAMTIDTETFPPNALLVRGRATTELVAGVPPEYLEASRKAVPPADWEGFEQAVRALYKEMTRIVVTPEWAKVLDFVTRLPSPVEELIRQASAGEA